MSPQNREVYSNEASVYAADKYWGQDEQAIVENYFVGVKLLVIGCGAGRTLKPLYQSGFNVTGIDIVPEMVREAVKNMADYPVVIREMDAAKLEFPDSSFDTVFFPFHGIDYVEPDIYAAVVEASRVVKSNGVFIFSSHNRLYLKKLHRFFVGKIDDYRGLQTYRTDPFDIVKLKKYFKEIVIVHKIDLINPINLNWKDRLYRIFPWLSKTTYFICMGPRK